MTTSGLYDFNPGASELVLYAFQLCGIRPTSLLAEHMQSARMAANMVQSRWSAMGVNTWQVDLQTVNLVQGTSTYNVPVDTIVMLEAYVTVSGGINRIIMPISRTEWASYSNPTQQGTPTVFWFDRLLAPTVTLWPVPDGNETTLSYYRLRQTQDAVLTNGTQIEMPYYWQEAYSYALAQRLAVIWAPDRAQGLKALADEAYQIASEQNEELGNVFVSPGLASYYTS